ncbi:Leucine-rich repeat-containing protein 34 [Nowakowskiella sp. JEL0078]|nr:Leucine-rich repeat-containing protein 34 [Nowakowskiella sp. JEL0078]
MAMQVVDYLDEYTTLCQSKSTFVVRSLQTSLEVAIEGGEIPTEFRLNGNSDELRYTRLNDDYLEIILIPLGPSPSAGFSYLKLLDVSYNEIGNNGAILLAKFILNDKILETLILTSNCIESVGAEAIAKALHINQSLHTLSLSNNSIEDIGGMSFAEMLQINTSLHTLYISGAKLGANSLIALASVLQNNSTIKVLDIGENASGRACLTQTLQNDVMMHIARMCRLNGELKTLGLQRMAVSDWAVVDALADAFHVNKGLEILGLAGNKISRDGGVAIFRALNSHPTIVNLDLSYCSVQDEGAEAVRDMLLWNSVLEVLYLTYNRITGKGLVEISKGVAKNQTLSKIHLWGNIWDVFACQAFSPLIGGPVRKVRIGSMDDKPYTKEKIRKNTNENFQLSAKIPDPVESEIQLDRSVTFKGAEVFMKSPNCAEKLESRLQKNNVDFVFYATEGVLRVAKRSLD